MQLQQELTPRRTALFVLISAICVIAGAFIFQYGFGIAPCELCYTQRIAYYIAMPVALLGTLLPNRSMTIRLALGILVLVFLFNAGLAAYHAGVEWKFWAGPSSCTTPQGMSLDNGGDLLAQMQQTVVVSCADAGWRLFGISLAGWNTLISLGLAVVAAFPLIAKKQ
ncbi:disulfide bond formation protein B [Microvirga sp. W0021]|uniref:Disulfide bond formation protein B n=1 Tax=Hohaiivirga grylli TaxID=3133970 RepID=A0ABV0BLW7_9HYPH